MLIDRFHPGAAVVVFLLAASCVAVPPAEAQRFPAGSSRLEAVLKDAESAARLASTGKLFYEADENKLHWRRYCGNSIAFSNRGEFRQAIREASKALFLGKTSNNPTALAFASLDLAYAYNLAGDLERAEEWSKQALVYANQGARDRNTILSAANKTLGDVASRRGNFDAGMRHYENALSELLGTDQQRLAVQLSMVNTEIRRGRIDAARKILDSIDPSDKSWMPYVMRARGQLAFAEKNYAKAAEHYAAAAGSLSGGKDGYHLMWMQYGLGQSLAAAGERDKAIDALREATASARALRAQFRSAEFRAGFFGDVQSIYDDTIGLLADANRFDEALAASEESRARALLDVLRGHAGAKEAGGTAPVPPGTVVAVYHVLGDRTLAWAVRGESTVAATIPLGSKALATVVSRYRRALTGRSDDTDAQARRLYDTLVKPLGLKTGETLIVVPHRSLHYLPFHALRGENGYLVEERPVSTMPSIGAMAALFARTPAPQPALLAVGNPTLDEPGLELPGAEREVKMIGELYPEARVFIRDSASKQGFITQAPGNGLIHVAAHASVDEVDPLYSSIRLARAGAQRGELEAHEILKLDFSRARLITLSACESGLGKVSGGDEFYGFKRTFLAAGAQSLLVTLWPVEDESTAGLMGVFYRELRSRPMADALREAQLSLIKSETHRDPMFWAPFLLVGDWR